MNKYLVLLPFLSWALCAADISTSDGSWPSDEEEGGPHFPELSCDDGEGGPTWVEPEPREKSPSVHRGPRKKRKRASGEETKHRKNTRQKIYRDKERALRDELRLELCSDDQKARIVDILKAAASYIATEGSGPIIDSKKKERRSSVKEKKEIQQEYRNDLSDAYDELRIALELGESAQKRTILQTAINRIKRIKTDNEAQAVKRAEVAARRHDPYGHFAPSYVHRGQVPGDALGYGADHPGQYQNYGHGYYPDFQLHHPDSPVRLAYNPYNEPNTPGYDHQLGANRYSPHCYGHSQNYYRCDDSNYPELTRYSARPQYQGSNYDYNNPHHIAPGPDADSGDDL